MLLAIFWSMEKTRRIAYLIKSIGEEATHFSAKSLEIFDSLYNLGYSDGLMAKQLEVRPNQRAKRKNKTQTSDLLSDFLD